MIGNESAEGDGRQTPPPQLVGSLGSNADVGSGFEPEEPDNTTNDTTPPLPTTTTISFRGGRRLSSFSDTQRDSLLPGGGNSAPGGITNTVENGTNDLYTVFLLVNAALGAGLLNFPKSFEEAGGIWVAVGVQAILLAFIFSALLILAFTAEIFQSKTIQETMTSAAGAFGKWTTSIVVALYCFGTTVTFLIIIGDQFDRILASLVDPDFCHTWYMNRTFTISVSSVLFILPLCFSKKIDFLRIPSTFGVVAVLYIVGLIIYEFYFGGFTPGPIKTAPNKWTDVFLVVPDICFGYQCHVSLIPIYSCMKHRSLKHLGFSAFYAILTCCFCYTLAAAFGYLTFGSNIRPDILLSYPASSPLVLFACVAMALKTFTTYPILLFCGREAINTMTIDDINESSLKRRSLISVSWFLCSLVAAILIPDIGRIIKVLGSLAAIFIFIFPGVCLLQHVLRTDPSCMHKKSVLILAFSFAYNLIGVFIFGVVLTQAIIYIPEDRPKFC